MNQQIKDKLNDISLMLVMTTETDVTGLNLIRELYRDLLPLVGKMPGCEGISSAITSAVSEDPSYGSLKSLTDSLIQLVEGKKDFGQQQKANQKDTNQPKFEIKADKIDSQFLSEYIENHTLLLEDFEGMILSSSFGSEEDEATEGSIQAYLHNLKGDSGAIGLHGIEAVCHKLEDMISEYPFDLVMPYLLTFKQWMAQCFDAYTAGKQPVFTAQKFLNDCESLVTSKRKSPKNSSNKDATKVSPSSTPTETGIYHLTGEKEILLEFAAEAEEHLTNVESVILDSEGAYSREAVDTIFRAVHSIKGGSAYFSIEEMTRCSHTLENFLSEVRDGKRSIDAPLCELLLKYIDLQKEVLSRAKSSIDADGTMKHSNRSIAFEKALDNYKNEKANDTSSPRSVPTQENDASKEAESDGKNDKLSLKSFVKVDTNRLDLLIDSIGEMVIYSSMLIRHCRELLTEHQSVMDATHRVEKFSRDLQDIGMSMRLVPIKGLFQKMSRLVWDTSKKIGKEVTFIMEGEDTELDRNLIDKLADPLMHMIRNSLDHGIEPVAQRTAKGKSAAGLVKLSASHAGGSIHIRIEDDGAGLDPSRILSKAIEKGIVQEGQKLTETEIFHLIFAPGFSTAAVVTDISGRGVGMDVVRRNVESLRGRIHIESTLGKGSIFTIEIPLTLAIIDGIQAQVGQESFLIPSLSIVEFLRPSPGMFSHVLDRGETFLFRGHNLPLFHVADIFDMERSYQSTVDATIVVVESNSEQVALVVDEILGECSTVIKSLGALFSESQGFAGCAIMPKGEVALILDVRSVIQIARTERHEARSSSLLSGSLLAH